MIRTYSRHPCQRRHRSYNTLARCIWPRAVWVDGAGPYATLAHCGVLSVLLHPDADAAAMAKAVIDGTGCGHACPGTGRGHEIVLLADPAQAQPW